MRIGIDLSSINKSSINQGVFTYALGLINGFYQIDKKNLFQIYVHKDLKNYLKKKINFKNFEIVELEKNLIILKKINTIINLTLGFFGFNSKFLHSFITNVINSKNKLIFEKKSDFLIFLNAHEQPYNLNIRSIINFHDAMHKSYPKYLRKKDVIMRNLIYQNSANSSDYVIASSKSMKKEFISLMGVRKDKIVIINEGVNKYNFSKSSKKKLKKKFFFYPAQFWEHKNHIQLIDEFQNFKLNSKSDTKLYLCGKKKNFYNNIKSYIEIQNTKDIVYLGELSTNKLNEYYLNCEAVVMPSLYESSSLVILEGLSNKKIVVASDINPNKELSKNFKLFLFKLNKKNDLSNKLGKVLKLNSKTKKKIVDHNFAKIDKYLWKNIALKYYKLINKKVNR
jgi:glycosyltransferase involved in cell wall biosynthesis